MPCPIAPNSRRTGPRPERTARGDGRRLRGDGGDRFDVLREREPVLPRLRVLLDEPFDDVLLLREPGGEDVRVAMVTNLGHGHSRHMDHTPHSGRRVAAGYRRSARPRTYCACPRWAFTSLTTDTRRTPRVTGGSHCSSTTRSRSSGVRSATYAAVRVETAS